MQNNKTLVVKIIELVEEIKIYEQHKAALLDSLKFIFDRYQSGSYSYFQYKKEVETLLKGKTKKEAINEYNAYILSLLKRIELYNSQIFYDVFNDKQFQEIALERKIALPEIVIPKLKPIDAKIPTHAPAGKKVRRTLNILKRKKNITKHVSSTKKKLKLPSAIAVKEKVSLKEKESLDDATEPLPRLVEIKAPFYIRLLEFLGLRHKDALPSVHKPTKVHSIEVTIEKKEQKVPVKVEKPLDLGEVVATPAVPLTKQEKIAKEKAISEVKFKKRNFIDWFLGKEPSVLEELEITRDQITHDKREVLAVKHAFGLNFLKNILSRGKNDGYIAKETSLGTSTLHLERKRKSKLVKKEEEEDLNKITTTVLAEEAKRIEGIMKGRKALKIYEASFFGALANIMVKKISFQLLKTFPDFFKKMYQQLRFANIKILSNTYVNMMVFAIISSFVLGLGLFGTFFALAGNAIGQIVTKTLVLSFLGGIVTFAGFYSYPGGRAKTRRRSINTNLPFAINHMAAVAASGVSPTQMFTLISASKEYGEIAIELEKIVNYIQIFGYDVLTALKAVSAITPAPGFRDFFDGMISTTQAGGDLKQYLSQKAVETMSRYKMERKNYTETIATFSDVYTGILIAAPLFFVAALSLISMLGGKVGGMDVNVLIAVGTYMVIPFLNVAFIMFLSASQPDI